MARFKCSGSPPQAAMIRLKSESNCNRTVSTPSGPCFPSVFRGLSSDCKSATVGSTPTDTNPSIPSPKRLVSIVVQVQGSPDHCRRWRRCWPGPGGDGTEEYARHGRDSGGPHHLSFALGRRSTAALPTTFCSPASSWSKSRLFRRSNERRGSLLGASPWEPL